MPRAFVYLLIISLSFSIGCKRGSDGGVPVYETTGNIKFQGVGLEGATVTFAPQSGQPTAFGQTDANGDFVLTTYQYGDGAAEGVYAVTVYLDVTPPGEEVPGEESAGHDSDDNLEHAGSSGTKSLSLVPKVYSSSSTTPLSAEVKKSGDREFNFVLEP